MEIAVNEDIRLCGIVSGSQKKWLVGAHGFEVVVYDIHRMQILQSACCLCELQGYFRI
jgi:hypothetical protein